MEPGDLPGYLEEISRRVSDAALPVAIVMAQTYQRGVKRNLSLTSHPLYTMTPVPPGGFPSLYTGNLRRHILLSRYGGSGGFATASVTADTIYAAVQEYGRVIRAKSWRKPMSWYNEGRWWSKYQVYVPPRPYLRPTTIQMIADGSLSRAAMEAFDVVVWGR